MSFLVDHFHLPLFADPDSGGSLPQQRSGLTRASLDSDVQAGLDANPSGVALPYAPVAPAGPGLHRPLAPAAFADARTSPPAAADALLGHAPGLSVSNCKAFLETVDILKPIRQARTQIFAFFLFFFKKRV
jgi:hypothetical protein